MVINTQDTNYSIGGMVINTQDTNYSIGGMVIKRAFPFLSYHRPCLQHALNCPNHTTTGYKLEIRLLNFMRATKEMI